MEKERLSKKTIDFSFLPPLPEPRAWSSSCCAKSRILAFFFCSVGSQVPTKFGPNHFLYESSMNKQRSMQSTQPASRSVGLQHRAASKQIYKS